MRRSSHRAAVVLFAVVVGIGSWASLAQANPAGQTLGGAYEDGTVLVGYHAWVAEPAAAQLEQQEGATHSGTVGAGTRLLRVPNGQVAAKIAGLKRHREVRYAEPNYLLHADLTPNDPQFGQLWGLKNTGQVVNGTAGTPGADIKAELAWSVTTGSSSVVVGVVDTGIDYTHPDLAANVWSNPGGIGGCAAGTHGYNAITRTCDPRDDNNHGSHVSGTIGAVGNNGIGVAGVNWTVRLMGLKFLDANGSGSTANAITAIDFAVQAKIAGVNVRALNNSWGGGAFSQALLDEINKAGANGILFVAAAGNSAVDNDINPHYPSSYGAANEIAVAATDQTDGLAYFSNWGRRSVDLGAPGTNVLSTIVGGQYAYFNGTSMATPHVTGAAALILSAPGMGGLTVAQLKSAILNNVDPLPSLAGITVTGGRLNVCKPIAGCGGAPIPTSTPVPTSTPTAVPPGATATPTPVPPIPTATPTPRCTNADGECQG
jgi:subtilisin family serine protease